MSRTTTIVLLALGATVAGLALALNARRLDGGERQVAASVAASPQSATLDWRETYGAPGQEIVFTVDTFGVTRAGWTARVGIDNRSQAGWKLAPGATPDGTFGLRLFETGDANELDERNTLGTLPAVRAADRYEPGLPPILEPHASWHGAISAPGALVAGSYVRLVFGTLVAVGKPPPDLDTQLVWITDHAYKLKR